MHPESGPVVGESQDHNRLRNFSFCPAIDLGDSPPRSMLADVANPRLSDKSDKPLIRLVPTKRELELAELLTGFMENVRRERA